MRLEEITEEELQAAGLEKQNWMFGYGNPVYKDANNTYILDADTRKAWFHHRNDEETNNSFYN